MSQPYTMGNFGGKIVDSASGSVTGKYRVLQVITESVIESIAINQVVDSAKLETTIPPGIYLFASGITELTLTSGLVYLVL